MWSSRRTWFAARYWTELIFTGRLQGTTQAMKTLMGTIRQDQNKAFEREVATVLAQSGMPVTGTSVKRIDGRRLLSPDGADLGDIDAVALDPASRTIIVAEAKDFELARTPAQLANEAEHLLAGDKSAVSKLSRRATWVQSHLALVLRHFGVGVNATGWRVLPVVVTSRRLVSPRVLEASWVSRSCARMLSGPKHAQLTRAVASLARVYRGEPAVTATLLDDLGHWLTGAAIPAACAARVAAYSMEVLTLLSVTASARRTPRAVRALAVRVTVLASSA